MGATPFSLCEGGRLHDLLARSGFPRDARGRRLWYAALLAIAWLPLVVLAAAGGTAWSGVPYPLLIDPGPWVRFFFVTPLLIFAEPFADRVLGRVLDQFRATGIVPDEERPAFEALVARAQRLATSDTVELILVAVALSVPHLLAVSASQVVAGHGTWFFQPGADGHVQSAPGRWYEWISLPLIEFLLLQWAWRSLAWWRLLWGISRLRLDILPSHPDRAGGLSFLAFAPAAFLPVFAGVSALASHTLAVQMRFEGLHLADVRGKILGFVALELAVLLVPQFLFSRAQDKARVNALCALSSTGAGAARAFERRWAGGAADRTGDLLESEHPGAMADFASTYELVRTMRPAGLSLGGVIRIVLPLVAPFLPLLLFQYSPAELLRAVMELVR